MDKVNEQALKQLSEYREKGCHMLIPVMANITDVVAGFRLIVTATKIAPHPREGDVYPHDSEQYDSKKEEWKEKLTGNERVRFHAQGFQRLAQDANIMWSRPVITVDPEIKGRMLCAITGEIVLPDGFSKYRLPDAAGMDIDIEREALVAKNSFNGKFDEKKQWLVDRDLIRLKKYQPKLIITNAKNRVTERILGLKKTYTVAELEKPFVSVRVVYWPDMTDKFTRELFIKGQVAQLFISNIYGPAAGDQEQPAITYGGIPAEKCAPGDAQDIIEAEATNGATTYHLDKKDDGAPPFAMDPDPTPTDAESLRIDFINSEAAGQCKTLTFMAGERKYPLAKWLGSFKPAPRKLEELTKEKRLEVYDHIMSMPEKGKVAG